MTSAERAGALQRGELIPEVSGRTHHGETLELTSLGGAPTLVMFYPFAFSRVCSTELSALHEAGDDLRQLGAQALAISCDSVHTLRAYSAELTAGRELAVDLISDFWPHGWISRAFGVFDEGNGAPTRTSFILGPDLAVRHVQHVPTDQERDLGEALDALAKAR